MSDTTDTSNTITGGACALSQDPGTRSTTVVVTQEVDDPSSTTPILKIRLKKKSEEKKKVNWTAETIDNEHMNKKKSKCCCIYVKPKAFGESDTEDDDSDKECEHCSGHVENKK